MKSMKPSSKEIRWLLYLIIPFSIALLLHFLVPLLFVLNSNPVAEQSFNKQKIKLQQISIRSLSISNALTVRFVMQKYQNVQSTLIRILGGNISQYTKINKTELKLNNASEYSQEKDSQNKNISMLYTTDENTEHLLDMYLNAEPYIQSTLHNDSFSSSLKGFSTWLINKTTQVYFQFPSREFQQNRISMLAKLYQNSLQLHNSDNSRSTFLFESPQEQRQQILICSFLDLIQYNQSLICSHIDLVKLSKQLTLPIGEQIDEYTESTYRFLTPIYLNQSKPAILFTFVNNGQEQIIYPSVNYDIPSNMNQDHWKTSYPLSVIFHEPFSVYYQIPIRVYNFKQQEDVIIYMMLESRFKFSNFVQEIRYKQLLTIMVIPFTVFMVVSFCLSAFLIKCLLNALDEQLQSLLNKCLFILEDDSEINISSYEGTQDIRRLYEQIIIINQFHKFTSPNYFHDHLQLLNYHQALKLFEQLQYPIGSVLENIGQVYFRINQFILSTQYLSRSLQVCIQAIQSLQGKKIEQIFACKLQHSKMSKKYKQLEAQMIRRLFRIILAQIKCAFPNSKIPQKMVQDQDIFKQSVTYFKKIMYPNFVNFEYVCVLLFEAHYLLSKKLLHQLKQSLQKINKLLIAYSEMYTNIESGPKKVKLVVVYSLTPPELLNSYYIYLEVSRRILLRPHESEYPEIIDLIMKGFQDNVFFPQVHTLLMMPLRTILQICQIQEKSIENMMFYRQLYPLKSIGIKPWQIPVDTVIQGNEQEIFIMFDCCKNTEKQQESFKEWQKGVRGRAKHIFNQLMDPKDRISIMKFNTNIELETVCNLTMKRDYTTIIEKQIDEAVRLKSMSGRNSYLPYALGSAFTRAQNLQRHKVIIIFMKKMYFSETQILKSRTLISNKANSMMESLLREQTLSNSDLQRDNDHKQSLRSLILQQMCFSHLKNCKLVFVAPEKISTDQLWNQLGLMDINSILMRQAPDHNNWVFMIDNSHFDDIDRIMIQKVCPIQHSFMPIFDI